MKRTQELFNRLQDLCTPGWCRDASVLSVEVMFNCRALAPLHRCIYGVGLQTSFGCAHIGPATNRMEDKLMRTFTKMYQIVVVMMVFALVLAPTAAFAQESSITFAGEPLSGDADELVAFVMNDLRPAVATADEPLVVETTGTFRPFVPRFLT